MNVVLKQKDDIVAKSLLLQEALLRRQTNEGSIDFRDCFDANIGLDSPLTDERMYRLQRSSQLLEVLSTSHSKLASTHWAQCFSIARDELSQAFELFHEAKAFSQCDWQHLHEPCRLFLDGLREFVRVSRFVTANIFDGGADCAAYKRHTFVFMVLNRTCQRGIGSGETLEKNRRLRY